MNELLFVIPEAQIRAQAKIDGVTHFSTGIAVMKDSKVLIVRRVANDFLGGNFELPGGGVDEGESFQDGAIREMFEETGLQITTITRMFEGFDYSTNRKPKVRQLNFIVDTDSTDVVLSPEEHDMFLWVGKDEFANVPMSKNMRACLQMIFTA